MTKKVTRKQLLTRYALTGAAIGAYFGLFFRPARQPNLWFVLALALLIALVTTAVSAYRGRPSPAEMLKSIAATFLKALLILILLELRHPVYAAGGKVAVTIMTTLLGAAAGLWYAYDFLRQKRTP
jgi:ABC-type uncharacterized transport system permease subunit